MLTNWASHWSVDDCCENCSFHGKRKNTLAYDPKNRKTIMLRSREIG